MSFLIFSDIFEGVRTCSDALGCVQTRSETVGGSRKILILGGFPETSFDVFEVFGAPIGIFQTFGTFSNASRRF